MFFCCPRKKKTQHTLRVTNQSQNSQFSNNQSESSQGIIFNHRSELITKNGFLPELVPLKLLPGKKNSLNSRINNLCSNLPELLKKQTFHNHIELLNKEFSDDLLEINNERETKAALVRLTMLVQAYIFGGKEQKTKIPKVLSINLMKLCQEKQRYPTLTYDDYILNNFTLIDEKQGFKLENIKPLFSFTNSDNEAGFIKIHVAIEAVFAAALNRLEEVSLLTKRIFKKEEPASKEHKKKIIFCLKELAEATKNARSILRQMEHLCEPDYFYNILRPYVKGTNSVITFSTTGEKQEGVEFEGIKSLDINKFQSYKGPTGAQSSIVPALDLFLGIEHNINSMFKEFHDFEKYMPSEHIAFVKGFSTCCLKKLLEIPEIKEAYVAAKTELAFFRSSHMNTVHKFVLNPASTQGINLNKITGTGGAPIIGYLKERLNSTFVHRSERTGESTQIMALK